MDWKLVGSTFAMIFLAELGDKTQLAIFSFAAGSRSAREVMIGAGGALLLTTLLAVLVGSTVGRVVPVDAMRYIAGGLFIIFGALMIAGH
jgi:putative Ca2+/H+ antiporter (TMEM165/GDT1 family)